MQYHVMKIQTFGNRFENMIGTPYLNAFTRSYGVPTNTNILYMPILDIWNLCIVFFSLYGFIYK